MVKVARRVIAVGFAATVLIAGGAGSASALTSYLGDGAGYAAVPSARTSYSVKDTKGDGNRVYGDFWLTNGQKKQLISTAYNQTVTQSLSGGVKVSSFRACLDKPLGVDACATRKYF